jgi:hypothetical protein
MPPEARKATVLVNGWLTASNSQGNCIGVRRIARTTDLHVCETENPDHIIQVTATAWSNFLHAIKSGRYWPTIQGERVLVTVHDPLRHPHAPIETSLINWQTFVMGAKAGVFDQLPAAPLGLATSQWVSREATNP